MYVCICNSVIDRQIRKAVEDGCDSPDKLREELRVGAGCGKWETCARQLLDEITDKQVWGDLLAPAAV